jgi:hypothetical protein
VTHLRKTRDVVFGILSFGYRKYRRSALCLSTTGSAALSSCSARYTPYAGSYYAIPNPNGGAHACSEADPCALASAVAAATVPISAIFMASGTYTLGSAVLNIDVALSIEGTGSDAILSQANAVCVFNIGVTTNPVVRLSHFAIDGGSSGTCVTKWADVRRRG